MNTGRVVSGRDLGMLRGPFVGDGEARKIGHGDSSLRLTALDIMARHREAGIQG